MGGVFFISDRVIWKEKAFPVEHESHIELIAGQLETTADQVRTSFLSLQTSWSVASKMSAILIIFCLLTVTASVKYDCYKRFYYKALCHRFEFSGSCQPWALDLCKPIRTTRHDHNCPRYFCDVSCMTFC